LFIVLNVNKLNKKMAFTAAASSLRRVIALLVGLLLALGTEAAQVQHLNTQTATASGSGASGKPSMASFNIPSGKNRILFIWPSFERDHISPADAAGGLGAAGNTAGTGLGDNYPEPRVGTPPATTSNNQITAEVVGAGGTISKKNALIVGGTPSGDTRFLNISTSPSGSPAGTAFYSVSSFHIVLFESDINTLLGGAASGNVSISLPDISTPSNAGDDAFIVASVFQNVEQTVTGAVRNATVTAQVVTGTPGNASLTPSAYDVGQAPDEADDGKLVLGSSSSTEGFLTPAGHVALAGLSISNAGGEYDTTNGNINNEPNGFSGSAYFRNGGTTPSSFYTLQLAGDAANLVYGATTASFLFESDNADTGDAPISYGNPTHTISGIRLGASVDADAALLNSSTAAGDDSDTTDDENGVTIPATLYRGQTQTISVSIQNASGFLSAWIDWNADGDFNDAGEQIVSAQSVASGTVNNTVSVPAGAVIGQSFARFRVSTNNTGSDNSNTPVGTVQSGEVEDYAVTIAANTAPTLSAIGVSGAEDTTLTFTTANFTGAYTDPESTALASITVATLPATGLLKLSGTNVTASQVITAADLPNLTYEPAANENGAKTFTVTASDGGLSSAAATVTLTLAAVNDAPTLAGIAVSGTEDTTFTFTAANFTGAYTDPEGTPLASITVATLPATGLLKLSGTNVTVSQVITAANLGNLTYVPAANENGAKTFTVTASDGGLSSGTATVTLTLAAANDAPTLAAIAVSGTEDTTFTFTAANFTGAYADTESTALASITVATLPATGLLKLSGTNVTASQVITAANLGNLTYAPATNENGAKTFTVTASDGSLSSAAATVTLTLAATNDAPTLAAIAVSGTEDTTFTFTAADFTGAYTDTESTALASITVATLPATGLLKLSGANVTASQVITAVDLPNLTYEPAANENGAKTFTVTASDGSLSSAAATVTLTLAATNDAPTLAAIAVSGTEDTTFTFTAADFTGAYTDTESTALASITVATLPATGLLKLSGTNVTASQVITAANLGNLTYVPAANENGAKTFTVTASDGGLSSGTATVTLTLAAVNDAPTLAGIAVSGTEDTTFTFTAADFTGAYTDPESTALASITVATLPATGLLKLSGTNVTASQVITAADLPNLTYEPAANENGAKTFTVTASDGGLSSAAATVTLTLAAVNDAPTLAAIAVSGTEDTTFTFTAADFTGAYTDPESTALASITMATLPATGLLKLSGVNVTASQVITAANLGNLTYVPAANENGAKTFTVTASDGGLSSGTATVTLTLAAANDAPTLAAIAVSGTEDTTFTFTAADFTGAYTDPESTALASITVATLPATGLLKLSGTNVTASQVITAADLPNLTYEPAANENGAKTFTVTASDGGLSSAAATVTLTLAAVNDAPTLAGIAVSGTEDTTFTFTAANFTGAYTDPEGTPLASITVATLPATGLLKLSGTNVTVSQVITAADLPNLTYEPAANENGAKTFTVTASDGGLSSAAATVTLTLAAVNDAPTLAAIAVSGTEDTTFTFTAADFTGAYTDPESTALASITVATLPATGLLKLSGVNVTASQVITAANLGNLTYVPAANENGAKTFTVTASDGGLSSGTATVTLTLAAANDAPTLAAIAVSGTEDTTFTFTAADFTGAYTDPESTALASITVATLPATGLLKLSGTNVTASQVITAVDLPNLTYEPAANENGAKTFTVTASDGGLSSAAATVTLTLAAVNDAPTLAGIAVSGTEDTTFTFTAANFTGAYADTESTALASITVATLPATGLLKLSGTNVTASQVITAADLPNLTYEPAANEDGAKTFTVTASDGTLSSAAATVTLTLAAVNDAPTLTTVSPLTGATEDTALTISYATLAAAATAADAEGDLLSFRVEAVSTGTLTKGGSPVVTGTTLLGTGESLVWTPAANANGTGNAFTIKAWDGTAASASAIQVQVTVTAVNDAPSFALPAGTVASAGVIWTAQASGSRNWQSIDSSADGTKLAAVAVNGQIYTSTDSGATWTSRDSNRAWRSIASSADGTKLAAVVNDGQVYTSTDSGATWTARDSNRGWWSIASSADGTKLVAGVYGGRIYTSTDSGATWTARESNRIWRRIASSADGTKLAAAPSNSLIYTSTDSGVTWTARDSNRGWRSIASSADGTKLVAGVYGGRIYTSTDSGATWTAQGSVSQNWQSIASSEDGTKLAAVAYGGQIYTSIDSGVTWTARDSDQAWTSIASSADGTKLAAVVAGGQIYTSEASSLPYVLTVAEDAGAQSQSGFATGISAGPADESAQTVSFTVTNDNNALFSVQPALNASGTLNFTPAANANGSATVTVTMQDNGGMASGGADTSAAQTFTITVTATNDAPTLAAIAVSGTEDTTFTFTAANFTGAYTDPESTALASITVATLPATGLLKLSGANVTASQVITAANLGNLTYEPAANENGAKTFTVTATDGGLSSAAATVTLTLAAVNDAPTLAGIAVSGTEDTTFTFTAAAFTGAYADTESTPLASITVATLPATGLLKLSGTNVTASQVITAADLPNLTYEPAANENGAKTFTVTASDGGLSSAAATVTLTLAAANDAPTITDIADTNIAEDGVTSALAFTIGDVETAAGSLTVTATSSDTTLIPNANLAFGGSGAARTLAATPAANQFGTATITVTVSDGTVTTSDTFVLTVTAVNDAPTITDIADTSIAEDGATSSLAFTIGDVETAAGSLTVAATSSDPTLIPNTNLVFGGSGAARTLTVTPAANQFGTATLTVTVSDGTATTSDTFVLTVTAVNDAPTLAAIAVSGTEDTTFTFAAADFTGVYADIESTPLVNITVATLPATGLLKLSGINVTAGQVIPAANLGNLTYVPAVNENGAKTFTVTASDGGLSSAAATVTLTLAAVNDAPTLAAIAVSGTEDTTFIFAAADFTGGYSDIESTALASITVATLPATGLLKLSGTNVTASQVIPAANLGNLTYVPAANENGAKTFTVTASDGTASSTATTVTMTLAAVNDAPTLTSIANQTTLSGTATAALAFTVGDVETAPGSLGMTATSDNLTFVPNVNIVLGGSGAARTVTVTPVAGQSGTATIMLTVTDEGALTATSSFTVTLLNTAPVVATPIPDQAGVYGTAFSYAFPANTFTDIDAGDALTYTVGTLPAGITFNATTRTFSGTPTAPSSTSVTVTATDNLGLAVSNAFVLTIAKAPLTITADAKTKVYGAASPALTATLTGFVNGENLGTSGVTGAASVTTTATNASGVGSATLTAAIGTLGSANYTFATFTDGTLTITKAPLSVTADAKTKAYGAANPALTATITGYVNGETSAVVSGTPALSTVANPTSSVGGYAITAAIGTLTSANYSFGLVDGSLTVTKAPLTVTADDKTRTSGAADPTFTATLTGFVNGETSAVVTGAATFSSTATPTSAAGTYPITPAIGTLTAANYAFTTFANGTLTVSQTSQTLTFGALANKTYGDAAFSVSATTSSGLTPSYSIVSGPATLSGSTVTITGAGTVVVRASQAGDGSFLAATPVDQSFTVAKRTPAIDLGGLSATYDGTPKNVTVRTSPSDLTYTLTYAGGATAPSNAGSYAVVATVNSANVAGSASGTLVIAPATQSVSFGALPPGITVGSPFTLNATASSGLPVTLTIVSGKASIAGASLTLQDANPVVVLATQAGNENTTAATANLTVTASNKLAQTITFATPADQKMDAGALTISATASSGLPVTITVVSGPAMINGGTLLLTGIAGRVALVASQAGDSVYAAATDVVRSFTVSAVGEQIFFGLTGSNDTVAAYVAADSKSGTMIGYLAGTSTGFVVDFPLNADGTFKALAKIYSGNDNKAPPAALTFQGTVVNGVMSGAIIELGMSFNAVVQSPKGSSEGVSGSYKAASTNTTTGSIYLIVGTQGQVYALAATPNLVVAGTGALTGGTTFSVSARQDATIAGSIDQPTKTVRGMITVPGRPATAFFGLVTSTTPTNRLINLATRAQVGAGGATSLIAGFVIGGSDPKAMLLRAAGPALTNFGLPNAVSNPRLVLFDSTGMIIAQNEGWSAAIAGAMNQVGAFPFTPGSADAALALTLAPGAYSMQVFGVGGTGVALAEIYTASVNPQAQLQRLISISSRGVVAAGDGVLIGGFVILGNSPKTVLIRGIGPSLALFDVPGVLADSKLTLYSGSTLIAQNDDWGVGEGVNSAQTVATAAQITAAAQATGAFKLPVNSKDAALIITLAPGSYSTHVSGANGTGGVALVEIYELP
jgi:large repetitive protein